MQSYEVSRSTFLSYQDFWNACTGKMSGHNLCVLGSLIFFLSSNKQYISNIHDKSKFTKIICICIKIKKQKNTTLCRNRKSEYPEKTTDLPQVTVIIMTTIIGHIKYASVYNIHRFMALSITDSNIGGGGKTFRFSCG
jgi:hypothetical protein